MEEKNTLMEKIVSLCKRRGFVFPDSEIYGGLAGFWAYGHLGVAFKQNIKNLWWRMIVGSRDDMYGIDAPIVMHPRVWEASGHVSGFADPLADGTSFNTMLRTSVGAGKEATTAYLRPETAQGIFANFKSVVDAYHPVAPFGVAQIGKAFRNEIAPRDFLFRTREFEQMEVEYFVRPEDWERAFEEWRAVAQEFIAALGIVSTQVHELEVPDEDRAHYSKRTIDFEYDFPFGRKELCGLAYRTDFDLKNHFKEPPYREDGGEPFYPHVIEPSFGVDRLVLASLFSAYDEDALGGEKRVVLRLPSHLAPVRAAVFPLLKNRPELVEKAKEVRATLRQSIPNIAWDDNGNIGKRYRRQDEIGTPHCITIDFETLDGEHKDTVTIRERDSGEQKRVAVAELVSALWEG